MLEPKMDDFERLCRLIAYVNLAGLMTEGELSHLLLTDRLDIRKYRDAAREYVDLKSPSGEWGNHALKRMQDA